MPDESPTSALGHLPAAREALLRSLLVVLVTITAGMTVYALIPMRGDWGYLGALATIGLQLALIPLSIRRARAIAASEYPVATAVEAIAFLLTILIFGFASAYVVLADQSGEMVGLETKVDAVYFAVTTLSTVGFGDIHAEGQVARVVVSLQMVFDLVFLAVVVRVMTMIARSRMSGDLDRLEPADRRSRRR